MTIQQKISKIQVKYSSFPDGKWGKNTAKAVADGIGVSYNCFTSLESLNKKIQKKINVKDDGIIGNITCDTLIELSGEKPVIENDGISIAIKYLEEFRQTPNISSSKINPIGIVLHHSSGSFVGTVDWCLRSESKVSYHCVINLDGSRVQLAKDNQRAWHAGKSSFKGRSDCNGFMLGLAFSGDTYNRELTQDEINSAVEWILKRLEYYKWPKDLSTITTHRAVSPGRKDDPDKRAEAAILNALRKKLNK